MRQTKITVYKYNELSEKAKEKALNDFISNNDYYFLQDNLTESLKALLEETEIKTTTYHDLKLYYSLSYCQGDGLCFVGSFEYKGFNFYIKHHGNYYYKSSVTIYIEDSEGEEVENEELENEFKQIYYNICDKLEKEGYGNIEYEDSEENFKEHCECNELEFYSNGDIF